MTKSTTKKTAPVLKAVALIEGKAAIIEAGVSIGRRTRRIDADVQRWAVSAVNHVNLHGDVRPVNEFFTSAKLGAGLRAEALKDYVSKFAKVQYNKKAKTFTFDKTAEGDVEAAQLVHWTTFSPEKLYSPMNDITLLKQLISKLGKADADKGDKVDPATASKLDAIVVELEAS